MAEKASQAPKDSPSISWSDTVRFIGQLSHDLRNDLNAIELQSAYIGELETNEELLGEIKRLREMVSGMASTLQQLSRAVGDVKPTLISYRATDFMEDLRRKIGNDFPRQNTEITWEIQPGNAMLNVDPQLLQEVFTELFANAFRHDRGKGRVLAKAEIDNDRFRFTLHEPKDRFEFATQNWGREPLRKISLRHYGLGLNRVRAIVEAHGGEIYAEYNSNASALTTTLVLPGSGKENA